MSLEERFIDAADGQMAQLLLDKPRPILVKQQSDIVEKIKTQYRLGKAELLMSLTAELCALEDLENALKSRVNKAKRAERGSI